MDLHTTSWCTIRLRFLSLPFLKNFSRPAFPSKATSIKSQKQEMASNLANMN